MKIVHFPAKMSICASNKPYLKLFFLAKLNRSLKWEVFPDLREGDEHQETFSTGNYLLNNFPQSEGERKRELYERGLVNKRRKKQPTTKQCGWKSEQIAKEKKWQRGNKFYPKLPLFSASYCGRVASE